jgi:hypothetical protein
MVSKLQEEINELAISGVPIDVLSFIIEDVVCSKVMKPNSFTSLDAIQKLAWDSSLEENIDCLRLLRDLREKKHHVRT